MRKNRRSTGDIAIEMMKKAEINEIDEGHDDLLLDIFYIAKKEGILSKTTTNTHRIKAVMKALKRDSRFKKFRIEAKFTLERQPFIYLQIIEKKE